MPLITSRHWEDADHGLLHRCYHSELSLIDSKPDVLDPEQSSAIIMKNDIDYLGSVTCHYHSERINHSEGYHDLSFNLNLRCIIFGSRK
jgi:5-formyltetrahydrofolate cyclo-ligase